VTDPADRDRLYGQFDHVRRYGPDVVDRLRAAGFGVTTFRPADVAGADAAAVGVPGTEDPIFLCRVGGG
jgi:hypothetical protein